MATRTLSRRAIRKQSDQAEKIQQTKSESNTEEKVKKVRVRKTAAPKQALTKAPPKPRTRKKAAKVPPRMFARWAVCDGGFKRVAVFDYKDRAGAEEKLSRLQVEKKGPFFLQLIKDAYDPPAVESVPAD
jgi:hypothetical protein